MFYTAQVLQALLVLVKRPPPPVSGTAPLGRSRWEGLGGSRWEGLGRSRSEGLGGSRERERDTLVGGRPAVPRGGACDEGAGAGRERGPPSARSRGGGLSSRERGGLVGRGGGCWCWPDNYF
jgi:hypothetical protein